PTEENREGARADIRTSFEACGGNRQKSKAQNNKRLPIRLTNVKPGKGRLPVTVDLRRESLEIRNSAVEIAAIPYGNGRPPASHPHSRSFDPLASGRGGLDSAPTIKQPHERAY